MVRRLLVGALGAVLVLLALGVPASAKGPDAAIVTGPGVDTTRLTWRAPDPSSLQTLTEVTRLWDGAGSPSWEADRPAGDLGSKFVVSYHMPHGEPRIEQVLYPFADAGPTVYMPSGQRMFGMDLASGWLTTDQRLTQVVRRLGGSSEPVESSVEPAAHEAASDRAAPPWGLIAAGAAGAVLLAAATSIGWRRLRAHRQA